MPSPANLFDLASRMPSSPPRSRGKATRALAGLSAATAFAPPSAVRGEAEAAVASDTAASSHALQPQTELDRRQFRSRLDHSLGRKHFELHPASMARAIPSTSRKPTHSRPSPASSDDDPSTLVLLPVYLEAFPGGSGADATPGPPPATPIDTSVYGSSPSVRSHNFLPLERRGRGMVRKPSTARGREPIPSAARGFGHASTVAPIQVKSISPTRRSASPSRHFTDQPLASVSSTVGWVWGQHPFLPMPAEEPASSEVTTPDEGMFQMELDTEEPAEHRLPSTALPLGPVPPSHRASVDQISRGRPTQRKSLPHLDRPRQQSDRF